MRNGGSYFAVGFCVVLFLGMMFQLIGPVQQLLDSQNDRDDSVAVVHVEP